MSLKPRTYQLSIFHPPAHYAYPATNLQEDHHRRCMEATFTAARWWLHYGGNYGETASQWMSAVAMNHHYIRSVCSGTTTVRFLASHRCTRSIVAIVSRTKCVLLECFPTVSPSNILHCSQSIQSFVELQTWYNSWWLVPQTTPYFVRLLQVRNHSLLEGWT